MTTESIWKKVDRGLMAIVVLVVLGLALGWILKKTSATAAICIIAIAVFLVLGRQFYLNNDSLFSRARIFVQELMVTSIVISILFFIVRWVIRLF